MRYCWILLSVLLPGCTVLPPAFDDARVENISYTQVLKETQKYIGKYVKWGGVVVDVKKEEGSSLMQVMSYPLDRYGRPKIDQPAEGYFLLESESLVDQDVVSESREIVTVGVIAGSYQSADQYGGVALPLINATAVHIWPIAYRDNYYRYCPDCYFDQLFW